MIQRFDLAPLDGITKLVFRQVWHRRFGGADRYFIPFFSPTPHHLMTPRDLRELEPCANAGMNAVPQIMTCQAADFIWAAGILRDMGYGEVNLNLGCPSGTVTAKGKGAGFLGKPEALDAFFAEVFSKVDVAVSVKTRLGLAEETEFGRILEIYNRYPIASLILHPRVQKEKYRGAVHMDAFARAIQISRNPLCYNGELRTVSDVRTLEAQFPALGCTMIGRGAVADPALLRKLRGGPAAARAELQTFTSELYAAYTDFYGGQTATAAQRMKEVWFYLIHLFQNSDKLSKNLRRSRGAAEYTRIEAEIFSTLPLLSDCGPGELY